MDFSELGGRFGYFLFFLCLGEGKGVRGTRNGVGGASFLIENPRRGVSQERGGGGGARGREGVCGDLGGGGELNIFFRGPNAHQEKNSRRLEFHGTVDFKKHPARKVGTRSWQCGPKVPGRFAFLVPEILEFVAFRDSGKFFQQFSGTFREFSRRTPEQTPETATAFLSFLNFGADFSHFFPRKKAQTNPPKNPPHNSLGNLFRRIPLRFLQKPFLDKTIISKEAQWYAGSFQL